MYPEPLFEMPCMAKKLILFSYNLKIFSFNFIAIYSWVIISEENPGH